MLCLIFVFANCCLRIADLIIIYYSPNENNEGVLIEKINIMIYTFTIMWVFIAFIFDIYKWSLFIARADPELNVDYANDILKGRHRKLKIALVMS